MSRVRVPAGLFQCLKLNFFREKFIRRFFSLSFIGLFATPTYFVLQSVYILVHMSLINSINFRRFLKFFFNFFFSLEVLFDLNYFGSCFADLVN